MSHCDISCHNLRIAPPIVDYFRKELLYTVQEKEAATTCGMLWLERKKAKKMEFTNSSEFFRQIGRKAPSRCESVCGNGRRSLGEP